LGTQPAAGWAVHAYRRSKPPQVSDTGQTSGTQPAGGWAVQALIDYYIIRFQAAASGVLQPDLYALAGDKTGITDVY